ncbi:MAG: tetratricopeptide repeat protein [Chloroflexi bacterium]|nr:tetratricopeptide repeat protein [Chloroflexota bacterium]
MKKLALISYQGNIYTHMGDYLKAKEIYHECLQQYEALSDKGNYAITLTKLANVADLQGNISESLNLLKEARNVSNATGNKLTLAMIDLSLSSVYYKAREWASGLAAAQSAQVLAYELHKPQIETMALLNIILFHTELRNWQKADILAHDLEQRLDTSGDLVKLSQLKNTRGIAAYHQGHYLEAEKAWQETLKINSQINQTSELANSYNNLGMVYTKLNELNTASSMLLNAARIYKDNGDIFNWANALDNLAEVYERQGNKIMARDVLCMALLELTETDNKPYSEGLLTIIKERIEALTLSNFR